MKLIYSIYCTTYFQAVIIRERISKIQIKTILMTDILKNETGYHTNMEYLVNVLADVKKPTYMKYAIRKVLNKQNILECLELSCQEQYAE